MSKEIRKLFEHEYRNEHCFKDWYLRWVDSLNRYALNPQNTFDEYDEYVILVNTQYKAFAKGVRAGKKLIKEK